MSSNSHSKKSETEGFNLEALCAVWDSLPDGMAVSDPEGIILAANKAYLHLFGLTCDEVVGSRFSLTKSEDSGEEALRWYEQLFNAQALPASIESSVTRDGRVETPVEVRFEFLSENGHGRALLSIFRDITEQKRAEKVMQQSHERYNALLSNLPNTAVLLFDPEFTILMAGGADFTKAGIEPDLLIGTKVYDHLPAEIWERDAPSTYKMALQGQLAMLEVARNGRVFEVHYIPVTDYRGAVTGGMALTSDITERKQAEKVKAQWETIVQSAEDAILTLDLEGTILTWNKGAERLYGYTAEEAIGSSISIIIPAANQDEITRLIHQITTGDGRLIYEATRVSRDGTPLVVAARSSPIRDAEGNIVAGVRIARDITERKRAEEALRESQAQYANIFNSAMDAIITVDDEQKIILFNAAAERMFGWLVDEAVGQSLDFLLPPRFRRVHSRHIAEFGETGVTARAMGKLGALSGLRKDNTEFPVEASISQMQAAGKNIYTVILRDIAERKRAEEALRESRARLASIISSAMDAIITVDDEQKIILFNAAAEQMFRCKASDVIGHHIGRFIPKRFRANHRKNIEEFGRTGVTGRTMGALGEISGVRADGEEFPIEASISQVEIEGKETFTVILRDITQRVRAETDLAMSEQRFRSLVENSMDAIALLGADGSILYGSPTTTQVLGYDLDEFVTLNAFELVHIDDHLMVSERLAECREKPGKGIEIHVRVLHKSGAWRWLEGIFTNLLDEPSVQAIVSNYRDVTERKRIETQIHYQANLINNVSDAIVSTDAAFVIESWNKAAEKMYGWSAVEAIGRPAVEILHTKYDSGVQSDVLHTIEDEGTWRGEVTQMRKNGSPIRVQASVSYLKDSMGTPTGAVSVNRDISERKLAEDRQAFLGGASQILAGSLDYEASLSAIAHLAVPTIADSCTVRLVDDAGSLYELAIAHVDPEKARLAEKANQRYSTDTNSTAGGPWQVIQTGRTQYIPDFTDAILATRVKDPELLNILREMKLGSLITVPLMVHGRALGAIAFSSSTSNRRFSMEDVAMAEELARRAAIAVDNARIFRASQRLNEELEQRVAERTLELETTNKELEAFSYSVSHDLRAPVSHISGFVGLLQTRLAETLDEKENRYLTHIAESASWMGTLIDDLLSFSRVGRADLRKVQIDMKALVREVINDFQHEAQNRDITWHIGPLANVKADRTLLRLVWTNLISNALKYTRNTSQVEIEIGCREGDKAYMFFVRDNGVGFDMKYVDKLFGVFQRLHSTKQFEGTGIGLANVHRIISRHGGRTWAEGEINVGATISFSLPNEKDAITHGGSEHD